jgi:L-amino acid N-acyltransferase
MTLSIREAGPSDAAAIADIYNQAVLHTTATFDTVAQSADERLAWLSSHGPAHPVIVAEEDGVVLGWGSLSRYSARPAYARTAEMSTYVDEASRGRGVGGALAAALLERGTAAGLHVLLVRICTENEVSLAMYERLGFEHVGVLREVGEKFGRLLDVAVFQKVL